MRSLHWLKKVWGEIKRKQRHCVKSHYIEGIVGILLCNSFIELPGSNLKIRGKQASFNSPGHAKQKDKNMQRDA